MSDSLEALNQKSLDAINYPALIKDLHGVIIACNQAYLDFGAITSQALLGQIALTRLGAL